MNDREYIHFLEDRLYNANEKITELKRQLAEADAFLKSGAHRIVELESFV